MTTSPEEQVEREPRIWPGATGFWVVGPKLLGPFASEQEAITAGKGQR
jgi:hypothetical protein